MKHPVRRSVAAILLLVAPLVLPSCVPTTGKPADVIMDTFMLVFANRIPGAKPTRQTGQTTVPTTVTIGGLSGTYDIALGGVGSFSGTAKVRGGKQVAIVDKGTDGLKSAVVNIVANTFDESLTVTKAKGTFNGRQTTGGVKKLFKGKIVFFGTISGGQKVKGTIRTSGDLEATRAIQ